MAGARAEAEASATSIGASVKKVEATTTQGFKEATKSVTGFRQTLGRIAGTAGAVVAAINAINVVIEFFVQVLGNGTKAADKFAASLGEGVGEGAGKKLDGLREKIQGVQSELARAEEAGAWILRGGRAQSTIEAELDRLRQIERSVSQQVAQQQKMKKREEEAARAEEESIRNSKTQQAIDEDRFNELEELREWNRREDERVSEERLDREKQITEEKKKQAELEERIRDIQETARREAQRAGELNGVPAHVSRIRSLLELSSQQRFPPSPGNGSY